MNKKQKAQKILSQLHSAGFAAYLVGGCVRDMCMQKIPNDYDIATSALPAEVKCIFEKTADTGLQHGTVTVIADHEPFEVTTFRTESTYQNHRAPTKVQFVTDIQADLSRRDFTVNAMAYNENEGIIDPFGGQADLKNRVLRCVGNPETRFEEDALRILRGLRFACQLGFSIEENTLNAMRKKREMLRFISAERVYAELCKAVMGDFVQNLQMAYQTGVLDVILPELSTCFETEQNTKYHLYNVGEHSLHTVQNCPKVQTVRLAALLHDVAKPQTKTTDTKGDHFYGHESKSGETAADILHRLKAPKAVVREVKDLITNHRYPKAQASKSECKKMILAMGGKTEFEHLTALMRADTVAHNPKFTPPRLAYLADLEKFYQEIVNNNEPLWLSDLAVDGGDLIKLSLQGAAIGDTMQNLLDFVLQNPEKNKKELLLERVKHDLAH